MCHTGYKNTKNWSNFGHTGSAIGRKGWTSTQSPFAQNTTTIKHDLTIVAQNIKTIKQDVKIVAQDLPSLKNRKLQSSHRKYQHSNRECCY